MRKKAQDPLTHPGARDSRGTASRTEIRQVTMRVDVPRHSNRPPERSHQPRTRKAGHK